MMKLSVIVPVYKVEKYLNRCLNSLLQNNSDDFEIILVDDGSPDSCPQICDSFVNEHKNAQVIHKTNGGLSDARNTGILVATGDYIAFVDSDDYLVPCAIDTIISALNENQNIDVLALDTIWKKGENENTHKYKEINVKIPGKDFMKYEFKCNSMQIQVWQNVYRRLFLVNNNLLFKCGILHEDVQWTPRVFYMAEIVKYYSFAYYIYEIRDDSISTAKDLKKNIKDLMATVSDLTELFSTQDDRELYLIIKDALVSNYLFLYAIGNFYRYKKEFCFETRFLWKDIINRNTKVKVLLYTLNKELYCKFMNRFVINKE